MSILLGWHAASIHGTKHGLPMLLAAMPSCTGNISSILLVVTSKFTLAAYFDSIYKGKDINLSLYLINKVSHHKNIWVSGGIAPLFLALTMDRDE
jgi:hypothetical protein